MSQKKKFFGITKQEIDKGLKEGIFKEEDKKIIRHKNGEIVKFLENEEDKKESFPSTLFQFTQNINHTIIYQVDIQPYIDKLIEMNNIKLLDDLYESYETIIKNLEHYKSYNDELNILNRHSRDALSKFENNISKYINELDFNDLKNTDSITSIVNSYIDILFIYLISTYKLYGKKLSNDTIIRKQITLLKDKITNLYMQLLVKSSKDNKGVNQIPNIEQSLYGYLLFEKRNKEDLGIYQIEKYIKYDVRFSSITNFLAFIQKYTIQTINNDHYSHYNSNNLNKQYYVDVHINDISIIENKQNFIDSLFNILEKIDNLDNIYNELKKLTDIDSKEIKSYLSSDESFELLAIN